MSQFAISSSARVRQRPHRGEPVYFLACRGHLGWPLPTEYTRPSEWKRWKEYMGKIIYRPNASWRGYLNTADCNHLPEYVRCKFRPSWLKVEIPEWGAGGLSEDNYRKWPVGTLRQSKKPPSLQRGDTPLKATSAYNLVSKLRPTNDTTAPIAHHHRPRTSKRRTAGAASRTADDTDPSIS